MANLIITIISIALVAVAALMGAYYGGQAFLEGQAKARANAILNDMQQLAGALNLYALNHGGSYDFANLPSVTLPNNTGWSNLVPAYLTSEPAPREIISGAPRYICAYAPDSPGSGSMDEMMACDTKNSSSYGILLLSVNENTCRTVSSIARGTSVSNIFVLGTDGWMDDLLNGTTPRKFDCFLYDDSMDNFVGGSTTTYLVAYRWL